MITAIKQFLADVHRIAWASELSGTAAWKAHERAEAFIKKTEAIGNKSTVGYL